MPSTDQTVQVTLRLPKDLYQQVSATAAGEQHLLNIEHDSHKKTG